MRAVATAAGTLVLVVLLPASGASASRSRAPSPAVAKVAFGHLLHQLYGPVQGYWTCPYQYPSGPSDSCLGEVHARRQWHEVGADARSNHGEIVFDGLFAQTWKRHWSRYSHDWVAPVPGVASVNSSAYGWGFLASGVVHLKDGAHVKLLGYDGDQAGWLRFYRFHCSRKRTLITCRNSLGDAMRYQPEG